MMRLQPAPVQVSQDFCLKELGPADHLLPKIKHFLNLSNVRAELAPFYSSFECPSVDPVLIIRMLPVGHFFAIRSVHRFCD